MFKARITAREKAFTKLMKQPYSKKKSLGMHLRGMNPLKAHYTESQKLMYAWGKPLKHAGKTKELKQFKQDMLGLTSMKNLNKYL